MVGVQSFKQHALIIIVGMAVVAMLAFAWTVQNQTSLETISLPIVKNCKLQTTPCRIRLPFGEQLTFEITPKNPTAIQTLDLDVYLEKTKPTSVNVNFNGKTMNMGFLDYKLKPQLDTENTNHFSGKGGLSVCIFGKMEWIVTVNLLINNTLYKVPFELDTFYYAGQ